MLERRATRVPSAIAELFVKNIGIDPFSQLSLIAKKTTANPCGYDAHERPPKSPPSHSSVFIFCMPSPQ